MKRVLFGLLALAACGPDETITGYTGGAGIYTLTELNGTAFTANATLDLSVTGEVSGQAPCNSFAGQQTAPYPWFAVDALRVTRRACPDLASETAFLQALERMTIAEVLGTTLILSNTDGEEMVFQSP